MRSRHMQGKMVLPISISMIDWSKDCLDKGDHLNASGAERVSIYLAAYLKENYDLPDHRGEEAYASYTQMEKQYDRIVNEKIKEIRE